MVCRNSFLKLVVVPMKNSATQLIQTRQHGAQYKPAERILFFCLGFVLFTLLVISAWLKPNASGIGTHTQLGLPGCSLYTIAGIRCPGCGMTTAWAYTMEGDFENAIGSNVGGVLLCLLSVCVFPCLLWMAIRGESIRNRWFVQVALAVLVIAISISIIEWLIRLAF